MPAQAICLAIKRDGERCTYSAKPGSRFCGVHARTPTPEKISGAAKTTARSRIAEGTTASAIGTAVGTLAGVALSEHLQTAPMLPPAPKNLSVRYVSGGLLLRWDPVRGAQEYRVEFEEGTFIEWKLVGLYQVPRPSHFMHEEELRQTGASHFRWRVYAVRRQAERSVVGHPSDWHYLGTYVGPKEI